MTVDIRELTRRIAEESAFVGAVRSAVERVIVGQRSMIDRLLVGLLSDGHVLLEGVPGLAKTLVVKTLADAVQTRFARIQFTPDLLPADLIGTMIYNQSDGRFVPRKGPIFANFILADEINRAPAKVQSALLEAMQERQVTIGDGTHRLDPLFIVLATQNPIEQEGTYPLPEAQIDRFMLKIKVTYPSRQEEREIVNRYATEPPPVVEPVVTPEVILRARRLVGDVYMDEKIKEYILDIVLATRSPKEYGLGELEGLIEYGASPRASIYLNRASRAHAFLDGRGYVTPEDVKMLAMEVLRHRIMVSYEAEAEDITSEDIVERIFDKIEVP